jgi:hypothetical protein
MLLGTQTPPSPLTNLPLWSLAFSLIAAVAQDGEQFRVAGDGKLYVTGDLKVVGATTIIGSVVVGAVDKLWGSLCPWSGRSSGYSAGAFPCFRSRPWGRA